MTASVFIKVVLWWMAILIFAILNGIFREKLLVPALGSFAGLIISGLVLSGLILLVSYMAVPGLGRLDSSDYWIVGFTWLAMTLVFEFSFGILVEHKETSELLQAYTFKDGNIWPVVLAITFISPRLAAHLRGLL